MPARFSLVALSLASFTVVLASCGSGSGSSPPSSQAVSTTTVTPLATVGALQAPTATPATNPVDRVNGMVQSVDAQKVTLANGTSFTLGPQTTVTRRQAGSPTSLQPGAVVAVTAQRQPDSSLLASMVVVFIKPPNGFPLGQSTLPSGDLMTNATIATVQGSTFTATFPGGSTQVKLAPNAQIIEVVTATPTDIKPGTMLSATIRDGVAQSVSVQ